MIELQGSEKQVRWAEKIRDDIILNLERMEEAGFKVGDAIKKVCNIADSRVFIENRNNYSKIIPLRIRAHKDSEIIEGGIASFFYHPAREKVYLKVGTYPGDEKLVLLNYIQEVI